MPPDLDELRRRLTKRGTETAKQIELRLHNAAREMELWRDYRYTIISKSMEEDLQKFRHIMGAERYLSRRLAFSDDENRENRNRRCVVLGVTGSIAAYKSAELASLLVKQGHDVFVVMTHDATEFITPLTLQTLSKNPVMTSFFDEKENWRPGHIDLADRANLLLIAPATANVIAELAHGSAGHPLAAIALATRAPILIAPAMNGKMWEHAATQENVAKLKARGVEFIGPEEGMLACGYEGVGRLWKVDDIAFRAEFLLAPSGQFDRVRIVVTAGPTREPIDPVRFISNRSSGKMGYAIAEAALESGHEVTLISGPTCAGGAEECATDQDHDE